MHAPTIARPAALLLRLAATLAANDVNEAKHPVVEEVHPVHAQHEIAAGLEEAVGNELPVRGRRAAVEELHGAARQQPSGLRPHAVVRMGVGRLLFRDEDDVVAAVGHDVTRVGVEGREVAEQLRRIGNGGGIGTGADLLADAVTRGVGVDLANREPVAAAVDLKRDLAAF